MTINTEGYYVNGGKWKLGAEGQITGQGKQQHSEIGVYNALGKKAAAGPYLIVQDAFPCAVCDATFKKQALPVLVKVTANNGSYSADQGLGLNPPASIYPYYLWYHNGAKTAGTATAPAGFPAIPAFADV
ncbi:hypothetical protein DYQ93_05905 [Xanthomonas sp. LMG 8992]|uniref:hypothetical protein n=1 Tax=Xanthomonas sp. LMG 8992 TaxID=1591157 RepID=UPI00136CD5C4|nr:hypothetical protein [Xanthomonas sp. LMG 8992]MXV10577.1 hypothetical protein [Xanthomonas sp. LMG 8992]